MNMINFILKIPILILVLGLLHGCSDSDNNNEDTGITPDDSNTISLNVNLDSAQIVPEPVLSSATGSANLTIDQDTLTVRGSVRVSNASSTIENVHIHDGFAGTNGVPAIPFIQGSSNAVWNIPGDTVITTTQLDSLLKGGMYLSVHTQNNAAGELRGQIASANTQVIRVSLSGNNEVPPITTNGSGVGYVTVDTESGDIVANARVNNITANNAHIHQGVAGTNGGPMVQLVNNGDVWETSVTLTRTQLADLLSGKTYFNIHTTTNPTGDVRGQIAPNDINVIRTNLTGGQAVPPVPSSNGSGVGYVTVNTNTGDMIANVLLDNIIANDAHIHQGFAGATGNIAIPLVQQSDNVWDVNTTLSAVELADLLDDALYFNVHTSTNPSGEIRGQIVLDGVDEKPDVLTPSFEFIQNTVFKPICNGCHSGANPPQGLLLGEDETYDLLVGKPSRGVPSVLRVAPGDPDNSYLIQKLEGAAGIVGLQMPRNQPPLEQAIIDNIREWIALGAPSGQPQDVLTPSFDFIQTTVFKPICNGCHSGDNPPRGLLLGEDETYALLVNQPSGGLPNVLRVAPGDPDNSYLIQKLEGASGIVGSQMPLNEPPLSQAVIDNIREWIALGAPSGQPQETLTPSFDFIQDTVFKPICNGCHSGDSPPQGLLLGENETYALLVNQPSGGVPSVLRVAPGDPDNSYLIQKLEGAAGIVGLQMPRNQPPLSQAVIDNIRQWITLGAPSGQPQEALTPSFDFIQNTVFKPICNGCHSGDSPPQGLLLGENETYALLVNQPSGGVPNVLRVAPGDPDNSYLIQKLEGAAGIVGLQMPRNQPPLSQAVIDNIREWIALGAPSGRAEETLIPSFEFIQDTVFIPECAICHSGPNAPGELELDVPKTYDLLVGEDSVGNPRLELVKKYDPNNSYLIRKLEGTVGIVGSQMPIGQSPLSQAVIDNIREWITLGAPEECKGTSCRY